METNKATNNEKSKTANISSREGFPKWVHVMLGGIVVFFITGISNALFGSFFATCAVVLKNTSSGFLYRFVNFYFSRAASTELMEGEFTLVMMMYWGLIWTTWILGSNLFRSAKKLTNEMECASTPKKTQEDENNSSNQKISQTQPVELEDQVKRYIRNIKWKGWFMRLITIVCFSECLWIFFHMDW